MHRHRLNVLVTHLRSGQKESSLLPSKTAQDMKDEYANMSASGEVWKRPGNFELECGGVLVDCECCYNTFGTLNKDRDNAIFVCHALTGNSQVDGWWGGLVGPGKVVDTDKYFVVCANVLASCYGTCGPLSINPVTKLPYGPSFPAVTIRDTVRLHRGLVFQHLGVESLAMVIGGSMGGMQALEWLIMSEKRADGELDVRRGIVIGCGKAHTSWQIGISETQRNAIFADPRWNGGSYEKSNPPTTGLMIARQIAMITYRTSAAYANKFTRNEDGALGHRGLGLPKFPRLPHDDGSQWQVQSYLDHQGEKFRYRFDPLTYVRLTALMDTHDVGRNRGDALEVLASITQPVAIVGISSDLLYPLHEQQELVKHMPNSELWLCDSLEGHDAFILETGQMGAVASRILDSKGWVPCRDTTTFCLNYGEPIEGMQADKKYHEQQAASHRTLGTFHEQLKEKQKMRVSFWL
jgi:homoserine O-acetyltransferase